ncbi:MAG: 1-acyl-sn-glycerol-3-phosphate acyltransferase [Caldilineales bacterium]|nr:1-acyl-sn-glycerol-3-phosphate acyltransferase [Caldilineales bacterium]
MTGQNKLAHPDLWRRFQHWLWSLIVYLLALLLYGLDVEGLENVPRTGPTILYYNHIHYADPFVIAGLLRFARYSVPIAKIELKTSPIIGKLMTWYGVIYVDRSIADRNAMRESIEVLDADGMLTIAPEGTRSEVDHSLLPARRGIGFLTRRGAATLIPVGVWGTVDFPNSYKKGRRSVAHVRFGKPFRVDIPDGLGKRQIEMLITDRAMAELAAILPEDMRGAYAPSTNASKLTIED